MAVVVDEGTTMGVLFDGEEELLLLENLVEWAVVTTEDVGVPAHVLCRWATIIIAARGSNPRDEEEEEEENRIMLANGMEGEDPASTCRLAQVMEILPPLDNSTREAVAAVRVSL